MATTDKPGKVWATPTTPAPEGATWAGLPYKQFEDGPKNTGFRLHWVNLDSARAFMGDAAVLQGLNGSNSDRVALQALFRRMHDKGLTSEAMAEKVLNVYRNVRNATTVEVETFNGPAADAEMGEDNLPSKMVKYPTREASAAAWRDFYLNN